MGRAIPLKIKMSKGLEQLSCEKTLKSLGFILLERRKLRGM